MYVFALIGAVFAGLKMSPHQFYVGTRDGLHGVAFVHNSHPTLHKESRKRSSSCVQPISEGARWKTSRGYYLRTQNRFNFTDEFVVETVAKAFDSWACVIGRGYIGPMLGSFDDDVRMDRPNGRNVIAFGSIDNRPGTIALTVIWGKFSGPPEDRVIREFAMKLDQEHFSFQEAAMDLQSIVTHELGHALGLADVYDPNCRDVTMFSSSSNGETGKRTPEEQDIASLSLLYDVGKPQPNIIGNASNV